MSTSSEANQSRDRTPERSDDGLVDRSGPAEGPAHDEWPVGDTPGRQIDAGSGVEIAVEDVRPGAPEPAVDGAAPRGPAAPPGAGAVLAADVCPPDQPPSALRLALSGRPDPLAVAVHRVEYPEPLIWLWRRTVGASFAFILVTFTWYLLKLPSGLISDDVVPSMTQVSAAFHEARIDGVAGVTLGRHVMASVSRLVAGLGFGLAVGVTVGAVAGATPLVRTIVDPVVAGLRMIPGLALGPLLVAWFGPGEMAMVAMVGLTVTWLAAVLAADARTAALRAGHPGRVAIGDRLLLGARSILLIAWTAVLAAETILASSGLGAMVWFAQGRTDLVVAGMLVAGLIGFVADTGLRVVHYGAARGRAYRLAAPDLGTVRAGS
ncbi:MAG: hypothetical protein AAF547_13640 [Actinomycetota bacterium]